MAKKKAEVIKAEVIADGPIPDGIRFVTKAEFAQWRKRSVDTIERWESQGKTPPFVVDPTTGKIGWWYLDLVKFLRKQTKPLSPDRDRSMRGPLGEDDRYEEAAANPEYQDLLAEDDPEFAEFLRAYRAGDTNSA